jgi:transposase-like protein
MAEQTIRPIYRFGLDGIVSKVRETQKVINETIYLTVGLNRRQEGSARNVVSKNESASFLPRVLTDLKARDV